MQTKTLVSVLGKDSENDPVVVRAGDHHFIKVGVSTRVVAELTTDGRIVEYFDDDNIELGSELITVTLID